MTDKSSVVPASSCRSVARIELVDDEIRSLLFRSFEPARRTAIGGRVGVLKPRTLRAHFLSCFTACPFVCDALEWPNADLHPSPGQYSPSQAPPEETRVFNGMTGYSAIRRAISAWITLAYNPPRRLGHGGRVGRLAILSANLSDSICVAVGQRRRSLRYHLINVRGEYCLTTDYRREWQTNTSLHALFDRLRQGLYSISHHVLGSPPSSSSVRVPFL